MADSPQSTSPRGLAAAVKGAARELGFDRVGVARAEPLGREGFLRDWIAQGRAGRMAYLAANLDVRNDPRRLLDGARSVICLGAGCRADGPDDLAPGPAGHGYVARYARGRDYHDTIKGRAHRLVAQLRAMIAPPFEARVCVDTAPVLERELAARAGLGWIGHNTMLIAPRGGSHLLLAEVVTTLELAPDEPEPNHCGRCRKCLEACPTAALAAPGLIDASRCISYLTIELRDSIPLELREKTGTHLFGCDLCQAACPFNKRAKPADSRPWALGDTGSLLAGSLDLHAVARWGDADYREALRGTAASRATLAMWKRNAAVALGNSGGPAAAATLNLLASDPDAMVADHARWAVERLRAKEARG